MIRCQRAHARNGEPRAVCWDGALSRDWVDEARVCCRRGQHAAIGSEGVFAAFEARQGSAARHFGVGQHAHAFAVRGEDVVDEVGRRLTKRCGSSRIRECRPPDRASLRGQRGFARPLSIASRLRGEGVASSLTPGNGRSRGPLTARCFAAFNRLAADARGRASASRPDGIRRG